MVFLKSLVSVLLCSSSLVVALPTISYGKYRNNKVYRFNVTTDEQAVIMQGLLEDPTLNLDNWSHGSKGLVDIRIPDASLVSLKSKLFDVIPSVVFIPDVQARIDSERA
ncbi:hypothetical protein HDU67_002130 [Dinochytrium kinnereticum]|nr:hypothetical protein HDU67_002130 [Dinochytrium kinnereticum]